MTELNYITLETKPLLVAWIPSNNKIRLIDKTGFEKAGISRMSLLYTYRYVPEDTTLIVLFSDYDLHKLFKFN
jgi:hypothetical protein